MTRRQFLLSALTTLALPVAIESVVLEPHRLEVRRIKLGNGAVGCRLVHFSDLHHKGDLAYLGEVVSTINQCQPDAVCFTGDLVEDRNFFQDVLAALAGIRAPVFGVPGNHDYWSRIPFVEVQDCLAANPIKLILPLAINWDRFNSQAPPLAARQSCTSTNGIRLQ